LNPRRMGDDWEFDWREKVGSESASFVVVPCKNGIVLTNEIMH
jgi:hypothetical protein